VVYTVNFAEYVISAAELFYASIFSSTPQRAKEQLGFGTPTRALELDFRSALWGGVTKRMGRSSEEP